ncbi:exodeoxyribonuclease V subunit beta [Desulfurivibrio dismutans]|uniref:exodeoxyribonuclease V subunit beta n=1 Tax=Desulfurivibrio dismutans TaxID=1398908 RepID=UPI0023DC2E31|nr:exodeoxyribonuclease V subunit beta [Desulfurivibrio alkaliphilus]MDF1614983.1 exodeoxyribonuclease V subunit beta [Desulfurivibrio alkaliphilus]
MKIRPFDPTSLAPAPVQLIEASAGTGKTYSITSLYLRFILEQELPVEQILVLSFTEAATAELHARLRSRLQAAAIAFQNGGDPDDPFLDHLVRQSRRPTRDLLLVQRAVSEIDQAAVTTIHSFCHRVLQQGAFESGMPFELELVGRVDEFIDELVYDFLATLFHRDDPRLVALWRQTYSLSDLRELLREALRHRHAPLLGAEGKEIVQVAGPDERLPKSEQPAPWEGNWAVLHQAYAQVRQCWRQHEEEIARELHNTQLLKAYQDLLTAGLLDNLAVYLAPSEPASLLVPEGSEKLVPTFLNDPRGGVCYGNAVKKGQVPQHPFFALWEKYLAERDQLIATHQTATLSELFAFARRELPRRLAAAGLQSFDDLLYGLEKALKGQGGEILRRFIAGRYPVALIDEFQDTDPVQYGILQKIYSPAETLASRRERGTAGSADYSRRLLLIGDPKQAIYAFRGADIFAYLQAAQDAGDQRYTMTVNWRADRNLVAAVNALFQGVEEPFVVPGIDFPAVTARPKAPDCWREDVADGQIETRPLQFLIPPPQMVEKIIPANRKQPGRGKAQDEAIRLVAADMVRLLAGAGRRAEQPLRPADIAVLVRSNRQATRMQEALQRRGIKAVLQSRDSVFASAEARQLSLLLHGLLAQADEARRRAAMLTDLLGAAASDLLALDEDEQQWQVWLLRFSRWSLLWQERGFMAMMRAIIEERQVAARLLAGQHGERRLTNFRHLVELLHGREREAHLQPPALLKWLDVGVADLRPGADPDELRLESDEEAVQVLTIHRSKGLEFPVVYCPFLWMTGKRNNEEKDKFFSFHDPDDQWRGKITLSPDEPQRRARRRELFAEDLRLLYVALTRARHCCRVVWFPADGYDESALAYLLHDGREGRPPAALQGMPHAELQALLTARVEKEKQWGLQTPEGITDAAVLPYSGLAAGDPARLRQMSKNIDTAWRVGSFSQLIAHRGESRSWVTERDYDVAGVDHPAVTDTLNNPMIAAPAGPAATRLLAARIPLAELPAGAGIGNFWHRILELISFHQPEQHPAIISEQCRVFGVDRQRWQTRLEEALAQILATPLTAADAFRLKDLTDHMRLNEMAFTCPVRQARRPLDPARLARVFREHPEDLPPDYADGLAQLRFSALQGYLKGFVDLVCQWQGKWYVIDYKSNLLGPAFADYQPPSLAPVMSQHHYILQYHLYALALHRHLTQRLPDYDYQQHFGGTLYLFLRGLHPDLGPAAGVYHERPPQPRIEALSQLLE